MDKLKDISLKLKGRIILQQKFDANFEHPSFRHLLVKNYRGYKMEVEDRVDLASIGIKINSELAFSESIKYFV